MVVAKRFVFSAILAITLLQTSLVAVGTKGYPFGKIEYVAETQRSKNEFSSSKSVSFLQKYLLGYTGSIYSPKLFKYYTEAGYDIDDVKRETDGDDTTNKVTKINYKLRADVISGTSYPFTLFYENYNTPYVTTNADGSSYADQVIDRYGIRGSMGLKYFGLSYHAEEKDMKTTRDFSETHQISSDYSVTLRKSFNNVNADISHTYRDSQTDEQDENAAVVWSDNDKTKTTRANVDWLPSKVLKVNAHASRREYSTVQDTGYTRDTNDIVGITRVSWNPTKKYAASLQASANRMETNGAVSDTATMSINSRYQISSVLSTSQGVMYYQAGREGRSDEATSIEADIRYSELFPLENDYNFRVNTGLSGQSNSGTTKQDDMNTTTYTDSFSLGYDLGAGISKYYDVIATNYSFDANYNIAYSDQYGDTARFTLSSILTARLNPKSSFKNRIKYTKVTRNSKTTNDYDIETYDVYNSIDYSTRIMLKGTFKAMASLTYIGGEADRLYGHGRANFFYTIMRNMRLTSAATVLMDYDSDATEYTASAGWDYRVRKITLAFKTKYAEQTGNNNDSTRLTAYLSASRKF